MQPNLNEREPSEISINIPSVRSSLPNSILLKEMWFAMNINTPPCGRRDALGRSDLMQVNPARSTDTEEFSQVS